MIEWTYTSKIDMTNGGGNDLTAITIASGLPSGIDTIEVLFNAVSTDGGNSGLCIRLGDAGGIETTGYWSSAAVAGNSEWRSDGLYMIDVTEMDANEQHSGVFRLRRWDISEHQWFSKASSVDLAGNTPRIASGTKTLSGELTQIQATTNVPATSDFNNGEMRVRYA